MRAIKAQSEQVGLSMNHKNISFVKSGFRIAAGGALIYGNIPVAGLLFIAAEVLGIVEEMV